ncbi:hypothetical protein dqs_1484 [Azoarcus olearius]|uniref:Smr/MutS family protein n=1 Tax=Azoarcus sp. (strain BH72) TaxID=418699 RepID=UPI0008064076|nr:Smr/MutS family protein [Azoarcus olearius]ANQ84530.1 hypothetical protein dqs_1484 [Azoarcus olearius]
MARRPKDASSTAAEKGGARRDHPFQALASLRGKGRPTGRPAASTPAARAQRAEANAQDAGAEDDTALFRAAVRDAAPIRDGGRKEIEAPRPEPVVRPREVEPEPDHAVRPRRGLDPLAEAYADVTPLRDANRVALGPAPSRHGRATTDPGAAFIATGTPTFVLPPDLDEHADPAAVFRHVVAGAQPLDQRNRVELERPRPAPAPLKREADERSALDESLEAPLTFEDRLDMGDEAAFLRPGLPRRVLSDLRRGRWVLQGEIDLHGCTREQARDTLASFLGSALQQGKRCVRVIHGKGLGSPGKVSILKQLSRGWLAQREEILAFCQAGPYDGGGGALLVLLRGPGATRRA